MKPSSPRLHVNNTAAMERSIMRSGVLGRCSEHCCANVPHVLCQWEGTAPYDHGVWTRNAILLFVLNYPIVGASLAVAVLSSPCQCPWTTWIHRGGHVLAHPVMFWHHYTHHPSSSSQKWANWLAPWSSSSLIKFLYVLYHSSTLIGFVICLHLFIPNSSLYINPFTSFINWWLKVWDMFQEYLLMVVNYPPWNKQQVYSLWKSMVGRWSGFTVSFQGGYHFTRWATTSRFTSYNTYRAFRRPGRASPCQNKSTQNRTPRHFPRPAIVSFVEALLAKVTWKGQKSSFFGGGMVILIMGIFIMGIDM